MAKTSDFNKQILVRANANLKQLFGDHPKYKAIALKEIEAVYERNVLGITADAKTSKGNKKGYLTGILYLAPAKLSGIEMCPGRTAGCTASCLFTAGRGKFYSTTRARTIKTLAYHFDKPRFTLSIKESIRQLLVKAKNKNMVPVVRLNGTSDILWERNTDIMQAFPDVQFYDYTKIAQRFNFTLPANYHLTFSAAENNDVAVKEVLSKGGSVATVFRSKDFPSTYWGYQVVNGDDTDLRFLDPKGVVVALFAKGKAKKDKSGFVKDVTVDQVGPTAILSKVLEVYQQEKSLEGAVA